MKIKRPIKISFRTSKEESQKLSDYSKKHSLSKSEVLQGIIDNDILAKTKLEKPKEYKEPMVPKSNIRSNAKVISNLNVLINVVRVNYLQSKGSWSNLNKLAHELSHQKMGPNDVNKLIGAFKNIGYQIRENTRTNQSVYKCLDLIESEVK